MRLWLATFRSARNSLTNVRCAEARLFNRGAFYKLGTEHGVLKQLYSRSEFSILQEKLLTLCGIRGPRGKIITNRCLFTIADRRPRLHSMRLHYQVLNESLQM
ncbi:hypothetical protein TNCT_15381 [Trichonephila clavata]|uniref:Uncharacterized protein n=1 Tax=Trichonephila clavata TaxID=2740835 RepID=A0A8X6KG92_TRICU|nr:hypothetical protein TNCT_15381 [Trichonephila clavata]